MEEGESHIVSFRSLGPKTYTYTTNTVRVEIKAKGISQNGYTENILDWNAEHTELVQTRRALTADVFDYLLDNKMDTFQIIYPSHLKKNSKTCNIQSVIMPKTVRLIYDKRVLLSNFSTRPFGTKL